MPPKINDVEANLDQFKSESLASQEENLNRFDRMQESIDRNKAEADKQFTELLQHLKELQPAPPSTAMPTTITPLTTHTTTLPPTLSHHTTQQIPPNSQNHIHRTSIFHNYTGNTYGDAGGIFTNTTVQPTSTVQGSERRWQPVERFFEVHGLITTGDRLRAAVLSLEGSALLSFQWINRREPFCSWEELKRRLLHRFQPSQNGYLLEQIFFISQQGTAREYVTLFKKMAAQLPGLTEEVRIGGTEDQHGGTILKPVPTRVGKGGISRPSGGLMIAKTLQILFIPEGDEGGTEDDQEDDDHFHLDSVEVSAQSVVGERLGNYGQWDVEEKLWDLPESQVIVAGTKGDR
ncbi:ankyrin repeat-containing protein [Tanacetum coccineum]